PFMVTVLGVVFTDLLTGVVLGLAVAVTLMLQHNFKNSHFLHLESRDPEIGRHVVRMRLAEEVTFLNKGAIKQELAALPDGTELIIDQSNCVLINHDVREIIADFIKTAPARGITVSVVEQVPPADRPRAGLRQAA
ncbi:MAG: SulP family inorganic anion transporter, partial [Gammaproteobacteria bacterium]